MTSYDDSESSEYSRDQRNKSKGGRKQDNQSESAYDGYDDSRV